MSMVIFYSLKSIVLSKLPVQSPEPGMTQAQADSLDPVSVLCSTVGPLGGG